MEDIETQLAQVEAQINALPTRGDALVGMVLAMVRIVREQKSELETLDRRVAELERRTERPT